VPGKDYDKLNYCRMYLQVTTLSDIATFDRQQIHLETFEGEKDLTSREKTINWPHHQKLDRRMWNKWQ
jgi:hypothetical protein